MLGGPIKKQKAFFRLLRRANPECDKRGELCCADRRSARYLQERATGFISTALTLLLDSTSLTAPQRIVIPSSRILVSPRRFTATQCSVSIVRQQSRRHLWTKHVHAESPASARGNVFQESTIKISISGGEHTPSRLVQLHPGPTRYPCHGEALFSRCVLGSAPKILDLLNQRVNQLDV